MSPNSASLAEAWKDRDFSVPARHTLYKVKSINEGCPLRRPLRRRLHCGHHEELLHVHVLGVVFLSNNDNKKPLRPKSAEVRAFLFFPLCTNMA